MMLPATVNIDGNAIRRIREANKLTQLYVAKVVGVTTDTISRWENNRYPSIKRENAVRLAEALETEVENILQQPIDIPSARIALENKRSLWKLPVLLVCALAIVGGFFLLRKEPKQTKVLGDRALPVFAAPGAVIPVWIDIDSGMSRKGYIIREKFPAGWKLIESTPPPSGLDNIKGIARWLVKPGEDRLKVAYLIKVDENADLGTNREFFGEIVAKNDLQDESARIGGHVTITVAPYIWADINGDQIVDDSEMLQASEVFDEMAGVHLDWNSLEDIWDEGGYRWDRKRKKFMPEKPAAQTP